MEGFTGIIAAHSDPRHEEELSVMVSALLDERHTAMASYTSAECGVYLGWTSSTTDASSRLVFNRDRTIGILLQDDDGGSMDQRGAATVGRDAADELVESYERVGPRFLQGLRGWPAGVLVDTRLRRVLLWSDRYGLRRIYCHQDTEAFLFSTQAKSLLRARDALRQFDEQSLAEYFALGCTLDKRSLFSNVSIAEAGRVWAFEQGRPTSQHAYFTPRQWEEQSPLDADTFYRKFVETCSVALPRYFAGNDQPGLSLTGGVDSRVLLACHSRPSASLPCYTFAGPDEDTLDVRLARRLSRAANQPHHVIRLGSDFLRRFPALAADTIYRTDGAFDVCGAHEIYLNRLAAQYAPVRVTGNFGSELFRGIRTVGPLRLSSELFEADFGRAVNDAERRFLGRASGSVLSSTLFEDIPLVHYGCMAAAKSQVVVRSPYLDPELVALLYRRPAELRDSPSLQLRLVAERFPTLLSIPTDSGLAGTVAPPLRPLQRLLTWGSFKADYRVVEGLPGPWARLDPVFVAINPFRLVFGTHRFLLYRRWFRQELSGFVQDCLNDRATASRGYLERAALHRYVNEHITGRRNWTQEINRILSVELMHRLLLDSGDRRTPRQSAAADVALTSS